MSGVERAFLNALDGLAYVTDGEGVVLRVGEPRWDEFATAAAAERALASAVVGRSVFDAMAGEEVRDAYRRIHRRVLDEPSGHFGFEYRCDAPEVGRRMRMSISRVSGPGRRVRLLYQSQVLSAVSRPWMSLFEPQRIVEWARAEAAVPLVRMCGFCQRLAWPPDEGGWVSSESYYRLGGPADVRVSHGVCPTCTHKI
ncbi:hypothetical protein [uncultured Phenylobacterium sp.]|uniref:hypothetical protein n=1 Tax=uncultured Phenylobacterium sp. TaxID=349273 RepID=UPI0025FBF363|nr:hypothetical protein [uncultured Phenylobacterium sp.]